MKKKQILKTGNKSEVVQAGRDINLNLGITYKDARQIALDFLKLIFLS